MDVIFDWENLKKIDQDQPYQRWCVDSETPTSQIFQLEFEPDWFDDNKSVLSVLCRKHKKIRYFNRCALRVVIKAKPLEEWM